MKRKAINGDEQDVFGRWRHVYSWTKRAGATPRVKRGARRRERQEGNAFVDALVAEMIEFGKEAKRQSTAFFFEDMPPRSTDWEVRTSEVPEQLKADQSTVLPVVSNGAIGRLFDIPVIVDPDCPPGQVYFLNRAYIHPPKWELEEEEPDQCQVCDRVLVDDDDATHDSEIAGGLVCAGCCPECAR